MMNIIEPFRQHPITNLIAAGATTEPMWHTYLDNVSDIASSLLPILGVAWLVMQMIAFARKHRK